MTLPRWATVLCYVCQRPFSLNEWDDRHRDVDGDPLHAACCSSHGPCSGAMADEADTNHRPGAKP